MRASQETWHMEDIFLSRSAFAAEEQLLFLTMKIFFPDKSFGPRFRCAGGSLVGRRPGILADLSGLAHSRRDQRAGKSPHDPLGFCPRNLILGYIPKLGVMVDYSWLYKFDDLENHHDLIVGQSQIDIWIAFTSLIFNSIDFEIIPYNSWNSVITHRIHGAGIYANIGGILMVNVTIYIIHGSYGSVNVIFIASPGFTLDSFLLALGHIGSGRGNAKRAATPLTVCELSGLAERWGNRWMNLLNT